MKTKKEVKNCWEYWGCSAEIKKKCPAHQAGMGRECWLIATHFCVPFAKRTFRHCFDCPWHKEVVS